MPKQILEKPEQIRVGQKSLPATGHGISVVSPWKLLEVNFAYIMFHAKVLIIPR